MKAAALLLALVAPIYAQTYAPNVISKNADPSLEAIKIVIIGDGWTAANMERYKTLCGELYTNIVADPMIERMKKFIRFTRYDVVSEEEGCSRLFCSPPYGRKTALKVTYSARGNNALPACPPAKLEINKDTTTPGFVVPNMPQEGQRKLHDMVKGLDRSLIFIVTADSDLAIAWAMGGRLDLPIGATSNGGVVKLEQAEHGVVFCSPYDIRKRDGGESKVVVHELGHAVWNLGDEYLQPGDPCNLSPGDTDADLPPNLSIAGAKWQHLKDAGLIGPPVPGGWMGCSTGIVHPTDKCKMLDNVSDFCIVCEEAIGHGKMTRSKLVKSQSPAQSLVKNGGTTMTFRVECNLSPIENCPIQYPYYWEVDGQKKYGEMPSPGIYTLTLTGVGAGGLRPGTHWVRFQIADKSLFCKYPVKDPANANVLPWDTCVWALDVRIPCASLSGDCLPKMETDQQL